MFLKNFLKTLVLSFLILTPVAGFSSEKSFDDYLALAQAGNTDAQNRLGELYQIGKVVDRDYEQAVKWYTKAADKDHVDALFNLGMMYGHGWGVERSFPTAAYLFLEAAGLGHEEAKINIEAMREI